MGDEDEPPLVDAVLSALWLAERAARRAAPAPGPLATVDWIRARLRPRAPADAELAAAVAALIAEGAAAEAGPAPEDEPSGFTLLPAAAARAQEVHHELAQRSFGTWLVRMEDSPAARRLGERVYDTGLYHVDMLDRAQLEAGVAALTDGPAPPDGRRIVDLGCATGALTEHLARVTGARVHGVDFARAAVDRARLRAWPGLSFEVGRLDAWEAEPDSFDAAVLFDTVYFVDDLPRLVAAIARGARPGGRIVAYVSAHATDVQPLSVLDADQTPFGRALAANGVAYTARDFLASTHAMWKRQMAAVEAMEAEFAAEGGTDLWESFRDEATAVLARHEAGRASRWMYVARLP